MSAASAASMPTSSIDAAAAAPSCRLVVEPAACAALAPAWSRLEADPGVNPVFLAPQWFAAWREVFGSTLVTGVLDVRAGGETIAVMPTMIGRVRRGPSLAARLAYRPGDETFETDPGRYRMIPLRQLSPALGLECGNLRGGFAHAPGYRDTARRVLAQGIAAQPGWDVAVLPVIDDEVAPWIEAATSAGLRAIARATRSYHATTTVRPWPEFLRTRSRHFRKRINPAVRRAEQLGLEFATRVGADVAGQALTAFFTLGQLSWKEQGRPGEAIALPLTAGTRRFFATLIDQPGDILPVLHEIRRDGAMKAAMLGLARDGVLVLCLTYYDPEIADVWPGRLLFRACFDWAAANGIRTVDFNANHPGWARFADASRLHHDLLLFRPGPVGATLAQIAKRFAPKPHAPETEHEG